MNLHISRFLSLAQQIRENRINESELAQIEWLDNIFGEIDYSIFQHS
jgi:predicted glycosyl hydrolase (DUF1957 family)